MGIELMTSSLPRMRSTPELHRLKYVLRAENEVRTRDPQLGRLMLYQLSYFRFFLRKNRVSWLRLGKENKFYFSLGLLKNSASIPSKQRYTLLWEVVDSNHRTLRERIYSPPQLPLCEPPNSSLFPFEPIEGFEPTTPRLQITCSGQLSYIGSSFGFSIAERDCKGRAFFRICKTFCIIFSSNPSGCPGWIPYPGSSPPAGRPACPGR